MISDEVIGLIEQRHFAVAIPISQRCAAIKPDAAFCYATDRDTPNCHGLSRHALTIITLKLAVSALSECVFRQNCHF